MTWEEEKENYIGKLERIDRGVTEILQIPENEIVTDEMRDKLLKFQEQARLLLPKLRNDEFEIAVVGLEKAGKSSFANALTGLLALPTDDKRCTYTSTCVRPGEVSSAEVTFYSSEEFARDFSEKLEALGIDSKRYSLDTLGAAEYNNLFESTDPGIQRQYRDSLHQDMMEILGHKGEIQKYLDAPLRLFTEDEIENNELRLFITDPSRAMAVKNVVIYSPELVEMPTAVLYDVPGFNSPTAMHQEQTLEKMVSADAIVMVANAKAPSITGDVLRISREPDAEGAMLSSKLFVFANKSDTVDTPEKLQENRNTTYSEWMHKRKILPAGSEQRFVFGSANAYLGDKIDGGAEARAKLQSWGESDGIAIIRERLQAYYREDRFTVLKRRIDNILMWVSELFDKARQEFQPSETPDTFRASNDLVLETYTHLQKKLTEQVARLRRTIASDIEDTKPLSRALRESIDNLLSSSACIIGDTAVRNQDSSTYVSDSSEQPSTVDAAIRKERFPIIYEAFLESVRGITWRNYEEISRQLVQIFLSAMEISEGSEAYSRIYRDLLKFCSLKDPTQDAQELDARYYEGLITRFARDLFELQILIPRSGMDRINKFNAHRTDFLSLGIYFNDARSGDGSYLRMAPKDSEMWKLQLFPELVLSPSESKNSSESRKSTEEVDRGRLYNLVSSYLSNKPLGETLATHVTRLGDVYGIEAEAILEDILNKVKLSAKSGSKKDRLSNEILYYLAESQDETGRSSASRAGYDPSLEEVAMGRIPRGLVSAPCSYEDMRAAFTADVEALRIILNDALVPAVDLDNAFRVRVFRDLENLVRRIESDDFAHLVSQYISEIRPAEMKSIRESEERRKKNQAVLNAIEGILNRI